MEVPLIRRNSKGDKYILEVCKDGLMLLRKLRNRKLRIVFNVVYDKNININSFNSAFLNTTLQVKEALLEQCILSIHQSWIDLSDERTVIIINSYQNINNPPYLSILGYLAASTILFHQNGQFTEDGPLTQMLGQFKKVLLNTDIDFLDQEIKYKKGYSKKPYFLCILHKLSENQPTNYFKKFYTYQETKNQINEAVDTLLDYFPQRSAISLQSDSFYQSIKIMSEEFMKAIVGRQLFSFEFTGLAMQNLCYQLCQVLNRDIRINLVQIYKKIIDNQKCRIEDIVIQQYINGIKNIKNQLPLDQLQLMEKHEKFKNNIIKEGISDAKNCMEFNEFVQLYQNLNKKIQSKYQQLVEENQGKLNQKNIQYYELYQHLTLIETKLKNPKAIQQLFTLMLNNIQTFQEQSRGSNKSKYILRLIKQYNQQLSKIIINYAEQILLKQKKTQLKVKELLYQVQTLKQQNKQLTSQFQLQNQILSQYKLKKISNNSQKQYQSNLTQKNKLKTKIQELQQMLDTKNVQIDQLYSILQSYQGIISKGKSKLKFSKDIVDAVKDVNDLNKQFSTLFYQISRVQERQKQLKKKFQIQKKKVINQATEYYSKVAQVQAQMNRVARQKHDLEQIIEQARQGIRVMKQVQETYKKTISELEDRCGKLNCLLADTEGELQIYRKSIKLLGELKEKGKSDSLSKFIKVIDNNQLRDILQSFLKK